MPLVWLVQKPVEFSMHLCRRSVHRLVVVAAFALPTAVTAQVTYSNTGPRRPLSLEDALPLARYAMDAYIAAAAWEQAAGTGTWSVEPGFAYGLAARTQIEVRVPIASSSVAGATRAGVAAVNASLLYALNVETRGLPAFAFRGGVLIPVGDVGLERGHETLRGIVTRTFPWARLHFNHEYTFGRETSPRAGIMELSRWTTGLSADRAFPARGLLIGAEAVARRPIVNATESFWTLRAGARAQVTAGSTLDMSVSRALGGDEAWRLSVGIGYARARPRLIPGLGPWGR